MDHLEHSLAFSVASYITQHSLLKCDVTMILGYHFLWGPSTSGIIQSQVIFKLKNSCSGTKDIVEGLRHLPCLLSTLVWSQHSLQSPENSQT